MAPFERVVDLWLRRWRGEYGCVTRASTEPMRLEQDRSLAGHGSLSGKEADLW